MRATGMCRVEIQSPMSTESCFAWDCCFLAECLPFAVRLKGKEELWRTGACSRQLGEVSLVCLRPVRGQCHRKATNEELSAFVFALQADLFCLFVLRHVWGRSTNWIVMAH